MASGGKVHICNAEQKEKCYGFSIFVWLIGCINLKSFVFWQLISRISMDHPHHTLFIILALANANKDEFLTKPEAARRNRIIKNAPKQSSPLDEVFGLNIYTFWNCSVIPSHSSPFLSLRDSLAVFSLLLCPLTLAQNSWIFSGCIDTSTFFPHSIEQRKNNFKIYPTPLLLILFHLWCISFTRWLFCFWATVVFPVFSA